MKLVVWFYRKGYKGPFELECQVLEDITQNQVLKKPDGQGPLYSFFKEIRIPDNDLNERFPGTDSIRYPNPILSNEYAFF